MKKFQIVLLFNDGKEVKSILFDEHPTEEKINDGVNFYEADGYRVDEIEVR